MAGTQRRQDRQVPSGTVSPATSAEHKGCCKPWGYRTVSPQPQSDFGYLKKVFRRGGNGESEVFTTLLAKHHSPPGDKELRGAGWVGQNPWRVCKHPTEISLPLLLVIPPRSPSPLSSCNYFKHHFPTVHTLHSHPLPSHQAAQTQTCPRRAEQRLPSLNKGKGRAMPLLTAACPPRPQLLADGGNIAPIIPREGSGTALTVDAITLPLLYCRV